MPIDPNIPLGGDPNIPLQAGKPAGPFGPDLRSLLTMQELSQRMGVIAQAQKDENALRNVFSQTGNLDEKTGYLSPRGLKMLGQQAPQHYMDYIQKAAVGQERQLRATALQGELYQNFKDDGYHNLEGAVAAYDKALQYGPEAAAEAARKVNYEGWQAAKAKGYPPTWISPEPMNPDITVMRSGLAAERAARAKAPTPITPYQQEELGIQKQTAQLQEQKFRAEQDKPLEKPKMYVVQGPEGKIERKFLEQKKDRTFVDAQTQEPLDQSKYKVLRPAPTSAAMESYGKSEDWEYRTPEGETKRVSLRESKDPNQPLIDSQTREAFILPEGGRDLRRVGPQRIGNVQQSLLDQYKREHPQATAEDQARFLQMTRPVRSVAGMTMQQFMQENPGASSGDMAAFTAWSRARGAAEQAFATGPEGRATRSIDVAIDHLGSLEELIQALHTGDSRTVNRIGNYLQREFNLSSAPATMEAARSIVGAEIVKAVQGGASALADRAEARGPLDPSMPPEQLLNIIAEDKRLMAGQLHGLEQQYMSSVVEPKNRGNAEEEQKARQAYQYKLFPSTLTMLESARTPGGKRQDAGGYKIGDIVTSPNGKAKLRFLGIQNPGQDPNDKSAWELVK